MICVLVQNTGGLTKIWICNDHMVCKWPTHPQNMPFTSIHPSFVLSQLLDVLHPLTFLYDFLLGRFMPRLGLSRHYRLSWRIRRRIIRRLFNPVVDGVLLAGHGFRPRNCATALHWALPVPKKGLVSRWFIMHYKEIIHIFQIYRIFIWIHIWDHMGNLSY